MFGSLDIILCLNDVETFMNQTIFKEVLRNQKDEITGHKIYTKLATRTRNPKNAEVLEHLAKHEMEHYQILKNYSGKDIKPNAFKVWFYFFLAKMLGLTFALKLMEGAEKAAKNSYAPIKQHVSEVDKILSDEELHEKELLNMIDEEGLNYIGSVVLGLNDALVELSGALAGFTFAIQDSRTIALLGLITGIAATFSMAASEFLSQRQEGNAKEAAKSSLYTGIAYIGTVALLTLPFLLFPNPFINLGIMMGIALFIILVFNFYIAIARDQSFKQRFSEMAFISIGVALLSFGIGWAVREFLGLEI